MKSIFCDSTEKPKQKLCTLEATTPGDKTSNLLNLPTKVLSEVASNLDFVDILSLQQTNKKLRKSTDSHVVWLALAKKYEARHFHVYRPETGSIDDFKTDKLRTWIRKRLVFDQTWLAPSVIAQPHLRTIHERGKLEDIFPELVPGGRWLLMGYKDGSVSYYDLDSEDFKRVLLIPPSTIVQGTYETIEGLKVYVDKDAPRLEFKLILNRLAVDNDEPPDFGEGHGWLYVWRVRLAEGGNSLVAERLASIPYHHASIDALTLERHLMAYIMFSQLSDPWIEVIWWEQCSTTRGPRTSRFSVGHEPPPGAHMDIIRLIGEDRILWINSGGIVLYDLPEPKYTDGCGINGVEIQSRGPGRKPIWSHYFSQRDIYTSPIYTSPMCQDGTAYRLVLGPGDGIYGLVVPFTRSENPSITKFSNALNKDSWCFLGICKAYTLHHKDGTTVRIGYSWNNGVPVMDYASDSQKCFDEFPWYFDEEGGRFLYFTKSDIMVVDFLH